MIFKGYTPQLAGGYLPCGVIPLRPAALHALRVSGWRPSRASGAEVSLFSAISGNRVYAGAAEISFIIAKHDKRVYPAAAGVYPFSIFLQIRVYAMNVKASPFFRIWLVRVYGTR